ncbi:MAG: putative Multicopper oxidase [Propionibacteriaceae bacterium]|nr:putative Multicopper oxidase [Propionibacteriaceae bacterium]
MHHEPETPPVLDQSFPTDPTGLPEATAPHIVKLADGDTLDLNVAPVAKQLNDSTVRMLGYNGSIPGPTLHVQQGSEVIVNVTNDGDLDTTVHWHGLRLENKYDGVPHETQQPIPIGGSFTYRIQFPDPGLYWYHPHIREDYTQEMGLYGNITVEPSEPGYWPPANRDVVLTLDDVLLENGKIATFSVAETSYAAMGRYGNLLLIGGQTDLTVTGRAGEVLRLWLTNTANTRVFNVRLPGARMKLIGGDSGRVEHEEFVSEVLLAPSERVVVDVLLDQPGELTLEHRTPNRTYPLASIAVAEEPAEPSLADQFEQLRTAPELVAERRQLDDWLAAPPDKVLALVAEMDDPAAAQAGPTVYACPMHPDVTSDQPGRCPRCGMKLLVTATPAAEVSYACPMHPDVTSDQPGRCPRCGMKLLVTATPVAQVSYACPMHPDVTSERPGRCPRCGMKLLAAGPITQPAGGHMSHAPAGDQHHQHGRDAEDHGMEHHGMEHEGMERHSADEDASDSPQVEHSAHPASGAGGHEHGAADGIEWEDDMVEINRLATTANMHWKFVDRTTGAATAAIDWRFTVGDRVKIRLVNEMDSDHPMHHPFHLHGAGRFLVLARDGAPEPNLVWKDTVLVRTGQTVDILFDVTNPGLWMAHCHIAEHMQSGMMFSFTVDRGAAR